ncbi:DUF4352 domain-containing protein [Mycobacterium sp.]|jgi:hypothetical protein|uniref:DUF4352 domain-containing protein n=1 Tax=Mycobacterium sp. TaxID=1785 RepID=UPI002D476AF9|nr:DUF4352 domain-containing protein [Mycobacterium sp.]HZA12121.1 DUF4352 domain-containing protein [Mycobacterium sp.]
MTQPTAGWYPDPSDPSRQRYFDGRVWTENYAPFPAPPPGIGEPVRPGKQQWNWKWIAGVGAAAVVLIAIASGGNDSDKKDTATSSTRSNSASTTKAWNTTAAEPSGPVVAPAGSSVRDGKFEFQVTGVERSPSKAGIFNAEQAKGEFFVVKLRVTNIGDEARTFWATNQKLIVNGNKYEASSSLSDESWREDINPGLSINTEVMFDVPPGAVPQAIVCHDSAFSGGAQLAL